MSKIRQAAATEYNEFGHDELINKINTYLNQNDLTRAYLALAALSEKEHPDPAIHTAAGLVALTLEKRLDAETHFKLAIRISPENYDAHYNLFLLHLLNDNNDEAMEVLDLLISYNQNKAELYSDRAILHTMNGHAGAASEDLYHSLLIDPTNEKVIEFAVNYTVDSDIPEAGREILAMVESNDLPENIANRIPKWREKLISSGKID